MYKIPKEFDSLIKAYDKEYAGTSEDTLENFLAFARAHSDGEMSEEEAAESDARYEAWKKEQKVDWAWLAHDFEHDAVSLSLKDTAQDK